MPSLFIIALGEPAPQGSKRHIGHGRMIEASKRVGPWRTAVTEAAATAINREHWKQADGDVTARMTFLIRRPKYHYRSTGHLRDDAPTYVRKIPDLDKIVRSTCDALTESGIWRDDAQLVHLTTQKRYTNTVPGAYIHIYAGPPDGLNVLALEPGGSGVLHFPKEF